MYAPNYRIEECALELPPATKRCPSCGAENRPESRFCHVCGASLPAAGASIADLPTTPIEPLRPVEPASPETPQPAPAPLPPAPAIPAASATPAAPQARRRFSPLLLIGGGCLLTLALVACVGLVLFGIMARSFAPGPLPPPTPIVSQATSEATAAPEESTTPEATATPASDEPTQAPTEAPTQAAQSTAAPADTPTPQPNAIATALAGKETPTEVAIPEPATQAPQPPEPTADTGVVTAFSPEELQQIRERHDAIVAGYRQVLLETFDQGQRTKRRWTQVDTSEGARVLANNRYELTMRQPRLANSDTWSETLGPSYSVEASVRFPRTDIPAMAGIVFDDQGGEQAWFFVMTNAGEWRLYRDLQLVTSGPLPQNFAMAAETDYALWMLRQPDRTELYFNAVPIAVVPTGAPGGGLIGVVGVSTGGEQDVPVTVYVDNLLVKEQ
jgi:hypothetical protein